MTFDSTEKAAIEPRRRPPAGLRRATTATLEPASAAGGARPRAPEVSRGAMRSQRRVRLPRKSSSSRDATPEPRSKRFRRARVPDGVSIPRIAPLVVYKHKACVRRRFFRWRGSEIRPPGADAEETGAFCQREHRGFARTPRAPRWPRVSRTTSPSRRRARTRSAVLAASCVRRANAPRGPGGLWSWTNLHPRRRIPRL